MASPIPTSTSQWILRGQSGFDDLEYQESVPIPALGDHDCLLKIGAVSLNYRDLTIAKDTYVFDVQLPLIPASDTAATVIATGARVRDFQVGERVNILPALHHQSGRLDSTKVATTIGGSKNSGGVLRQYAVFEDVALVHAPRNLSLVEAATLAGSGTAAWNTLYGSESSAVTRIKPGDVVLTQGTGGVSLFVIQFAHAAGATVIATTSDSKGRKGDVLRRLGVAHIIDYKADSHWGETAKSLTPNGEGVDHVVDVGGAATLGQSLQAVRYEGTVSVIGFLSGLADGMGPGLLSSLGKEVTVRGVLLGSKVQFVEMNRSMERLGIRPVHDERVFGFHEVREAYQYMFEQKHVGKLVIKVSDGCLIEVAVMQLLPSNASILDRTNSVIFTGRIDFSRSTCGDKTDKIEIRPKKFASDAEESGGA